MSPPQDSLTQPIDPTMNSALQVQVLGQIRDNLALIHKKQERAGETLSDMRDRIVLLEARDERLERVEKAAERLDAKVETLLRDLAHREGASKVFVGIKGWWPVFLATIAAGASIFSAVYMGGRAAGVIGKAPDHATHQLP